MNRILLAIAVALTVLLTAGVSLAKVDKLDIRGLVPGESNRDAVAQAMRGGHFDIGPYTWSDIDIGGIIFHSCKVGFNPDDTLAYLQCELGKFHSTNYVQFEHLLKGFTNKFGAPQRDDYSIAQNNFGVKFKKREVSWLDKLGNSLYLSDLHKRTDRGVLYLVSKKYLVETENAKKRNLQKDKF